MAVPGDASGRGDLPQALKVGERFGVEVLAHGVAIGIVLGQEATRSPARQKAAGPARQAKVRARSNASAVAPADSMTQGRPAACPSSSNRFWTARAPLHQGKTVVIAAGRGLSNLKMSTP